MIEVFVIFGMFGGLGCLLAGLDAWAMKGEDDV